MTRLDPLRRRESIIEAALRQAVHGYEAVQIRAVADAAGVSTSAVYHYFSSKDGLLLECLHSWLSEFEDSDALAIVGKRGPNQRLLRVVESLTERLSLTPRLADTMARAYLHATGSASDTAEFVRDTLIEIFTEAMHPERSQHNDHVAALMADLWIANVLAIAQKRMTAVELRCRFQHAISAIDKNTGVRRAGAGGMPWHLAASRPGSTQGTPDDTQLSRRTADGARTVSGSEAD
ncbi:TetR/AcrR family transcriptional regulator [Mycolicibacter sinensis]